MGFHLLAPSKEQDTGDVIAELTAGEEVGETGEKISEACAECGFLKLEWLLGYCISVQAAILLECIAVSHVFLHTGFNIIICL